MHQNVHNQAIYIMTNIKQHVVLSKGFYKEDSWNINVTFLGLLILLLLFHRLFEGPVGQKRNI